MFIWIKTLVGIPTDCFTESKISTEMTLSTLSNEWSAKASIKEKLLVLYSDTLTSADVDDLTLQSPLMTLISSGLVRRSLQKEGTQHSNIYRLRSERYELIPDGFITV